MFSKNKIIILTVVALAFGVLLYKIVSISRNQPREVSKEVNVQVGASVLKVGDEEISQEDLDFEYKLQTVGLNEAANSKPGSESEDADSNQLGSLKEEILRGVVERKVLYHYIRQDAEFKKMTEKNNQQCLAEWKEALHSKLPLFQQKKNKLRLKKRLCEQNALKIYMKEDLEPKVVISEDEMLKYYKDHLDAFKHPNMVKIRHILLADEHKAKRIRYKATRANFEALAMEHSIAPEAEKGGLLGPYKKGDLPAVFDIAFRLRRGDISTVHKSTYGFHIFFVVKKYKKSELSFEEAKKKIYQIIFIKKKNEEYKKWVQLALDSVHVETIQPLW